MGMKFGYQFTAAKVKRNEATEDEPSIVPMRPMSAIRRNPSTDQKKVRRLQQKKEASARTAAIGRWYMSPTAGSGADVTPVQWPSDGSIKPESGFFLVQQLAPKDYAPRYYAQQTGSTTNRYGLNCPTFLLWTVNTVVDGGTIVGVRGERVDGTYFARPEAMEDIMSVTASRHTADAVGDVFYDEDGLPTGWQNPDADPTAGNAVVEDNYDDFTEYNDDWSHTGKIDLRSAVSRRAAEVAAGMSKQAVFPGSHSEVYRNDAGEPLGWDYHHNDHHDGYDVDDYMGSGADRADAELEDGYDWGQDDAHHQSSDAGWSNRDGFYHAEKGHVSAVWMTGYILGWEDNHGSEAAIAQLRSHLHHTSSRKTAMPSPAELSVKVGDIFYSSWGYDQTNVDFYEVIRLTGQGVEVQPIASRVVSGDGFNETVVAEPGVVRDFDVRLDIDNGDAKKSKVCRLGFGYAGSATISLGNRNGSAYLWDGRPIRQSGPYGGH